MSKVARRNEATEGLRARTPVLSYDLTNQTVTVPGSKGWKVRAVIEDFRPSVCANEQASAVQDGIDELDRNLDDVIDQRESEAHSNDENVSAHPENTRAYSNEEPDCIGQNLPAAGDKIEVYWPLDKKFYEGCIQKHDVNTGKYSVHYTDKGKENLKLQDEVWNYVKEPPTGEHPDNTATEERDEDCFEAGEVQLSPEQKLQSAGEKLIESYYQALGTETLCYIRLRDFLYTQRRMSMQKKKSRSRKKLFRKWLCLRYPRRRTSSPVMYCTR